MQISSTISQYSTVAVNSTSALQDGSASVSAKQQLSNLKLESALEQAVTASLTRAPRAAGIPPEIANASIPKNALGVDEDDNEFGTSLRSPTPFVPGGRLPAAPPVNALFNTTGGGIADSEEEFGNSFGVLPNVRPATSSPGPVFNRPAVLDDGVEFGNSIGPSTPHKTGSSAQQDPSPSALSNKTGGRIVDSEDEFGNSFGVRPNVRPTTSSPRPVINSPALGLLDDGDKFGNSTGPSAPYTAGSSSRQAPQATETPPAFTNKIAFAVDENEDDAATFGPRTGLGTDNQSAAMSRQQLGQLARDTQMLDKLIAELSK